jgi:hypothetical protein
MLGKPVIHVMRQHVLVSRRDFERKHAIIRINPPMWYNGVSAIKMMSPVQSRVHTAMPFVAMWRL